MLIILIVVSLIVLAFWRSLLKVVLAVLVALLVLGGIQAVRVIGSVTSGSRQQLGLAHSGKHSTIATGSLGVGTRPSITFTRNSTAKPRT